ncbi:hypothetical protein P775_24495 [Puniceibacterium antarcticum]|uniref:DUF3892 domain-containing protein n=1 Tax=Puniceibacterium antarcticum TaxID=1206336 RepID=A0A2G8R730_9RHOB|nr:hypothetical protein [Puniceibacterium antarcticum]PIL17365.1 hypothetical protein P775_24495 [Puniceibacterium antarcticum]
MAAPAQVTWVKTDPSGAEILKLGGTRRSFFSKSSWELSAREAIALVEQDEWRFYVEVDEKKGWLEVLEQPDGTRKFSNQGPIQILT